MNRRLYLAAYDIPCPKRLRRALKLARTYASGGQKSIHECWLSASEKASLTAAIVTALEPDDRFALIALDPRRTPLLFGTALPSVDPDCYYIH